MLTKAEITKIMNDALNVGWKHIHPSGDRIIGTNPKTGKLDEIPGQEKIRRI